MKRTRALRTRGGLALACALVAAGNVAVQVTTAAPALAAVSGYTMVRSAERDFESNPSSFAVAKCPVGKVVIGAGGHVDEFGDPDTETVRLTRIQPVHTSAGDNVVVEAAEPASGFAGAWQVIAIAICANPLPGYQIVSGSTGPASPTFVATAAVCPQGKLVMGTGARVVDGGGEVWLQLMRHSGPRDISRATAREDANGQDTNWSLTAYAICADPIAGTTQPGGISQVQWAFQGCGNGHRYVSTGGGGGLVDTGPVWLTGLYAEPLNATAGAVVTMSGLPTGGMAYSAICVST
jgi:hypothetical protein